MKLETSANDYVMPITLPEMENSYLHHHNSNSHLLHHQQQPHFLHQNHPDLLMEIPELRHHTAQSQNYFQSEVSKYGDTYLHNNGENDVTGFFTPDEPTNFSQSELRSSQLKPVQSSKNSNGLNSSGKVSKKSRRSSSPTALIKQLTGSTNPLTSIDEIDKRYLANLTREERRRIRRATVKYRTAHASRERLRVEAFSIAFTELRKLLPTLPHDKKLSKIEILRLAIAYISYLDHLLASTA
ncbi:uncharacterized protein LOC142349211 [Convolutriloba macropyga]|uniref:uncharacterized protein LOC142349211 n=1 Tax=Convolutriloba macropyga TaxID=536237 RepID=UPI003F5239DB